MPSFWSRLGSWLGRAPKKTKPRRAQPEPKPPAAAAPSQPKPQATAAPLEASVPAPQQRVAPAHVIRLGLDFGTTTTLVAVRVDQEEPRLVPLERDSDWMPSYYWKGEDGGEQIGAAAVNMSAPIHSIKLQLPADTATEATYGLAPSKISHRIIEEALARAVTQLRRDRLLPESAELLEVASNVGCSAAWDLQARARLRDIVNASGLKVTMANLIEEPIAAALSVLLTGAFAGGRLLLVDMGGGTLDVCVLKAQPGVNKFTIFASNGRADLGGDRYTDVIFEHLVDRLADRQGVPPGELPLTIAERTRLWQVAEQAKRDLSSRPMIRVQLPDAGGVPGITVSVERSWFEKSASQLLLRTMAAVTDAYRIARLILDRGQDPGDEPGTPYLSTDPIRLISSLRLDDDALEHIDHVVLVGGASQMPMIRREFERIFGSRLEDPALYGLDPLNAVALGLAQHEALESLDFGYPNWAINAEVATQGGRQALELYSPFAPVFRLRLAGSTTMYTVQAPLPAGANACRLVFRRVAPGKGTAWEEVVLPTGATALNLDLSLLGDIDLSAVIDDKLHPLYPDRPAAPWKDGQAVHPGWVPKPPPKPDDTPWWDPVNDGPG